MPNSIKNVSALLEKAIPLRTTRQRAAWVSELTAFNYFSVFDIVRVGKMRFVRRHAKDFSGQAEELYKNALSFAAQLVQRAREQSLLDAEQFRLQRVADGRPELPSYEELFPEPWDNFCRVGATEALNSPVAYLLELYLFAQQLELDATGDAITLKQRRPDLAELLLDADNTHREMPALYIVNEVLNYIASEYIDLTADTGKSVNQVMGETHYPFSLPFSLPTLQITLGLEEKKTTLAEIIQALSSERPWFSQNLDANQKNSVLLAATSLSPGQLALLMSPSPFAMVNLTHKWLQDGYLSGSTTETLVDMDLSAHGFIVPPQGEAGGPETLCYSEVEPALDQYDEVTVDCTNLDNEQVFVVLRAKAILTYRRAKARLKPFDDAPPYSRQLELRWHDEDNASIDLSRGPYFGKLTLHVQEWSSKKSFLALTYHLAMAAEGMEEIELIPQAEHFFMENYGITPGNIKDLSNILFFIGQTKGTAEEVEQAIAHGDFAPSVSGNVIFGNPIFTNGQSIGNFPDAFQAGAVYLNSGQPAAIDIEFSRPRRFSHITEYRFDRLNRLLRLQRWTKLSYPDIDLILTSAMYAEGEANLTLSVNYNTLRTLGLFRHLQGRYALDAQAFAALICRINPFGTIGPDFFDQQFNDSKLFDSPLLMDNGMFNYAGRQGGDARTAKQICAGLSITSATFMMLAERVNRAMALPSGTLSRSLEVISALYRLVKLPQLFNLTPEQGVMLIDLLSQDGAFDPQLLAGVPRLSSLGADGLSTETVDILDVILALEEIAVWLKQAKLSPEELCLMTQSLRLPITASENSAAFFDNILVGLSGTLLTEEDFSATDIPPWQAPQTADNASSWMEALALLVTETGLIKPYELSLSRSDEAYLDEILTPIVGQLQPQPTDPAAIVSSLSQIIQQAKIMQEGLVSFAVAKEYGVSREVVPLLLRWVGSSIGDFLELLMEQAARYKGRLLRASDISEEILQLSYDMAMNGSLLKQFRLTPYLLLLRLTHPEWLSLSAAAQGGVTLGELYLLSRYRDWSTGSQHSEDELIEYLTYANSQSARRNDDELARDCAELLAEQLDWDADEIEVACQRFIPRQARTLEQIDWLRRVMAFSRQTGLAVSSLLDAAQLPPLPTFENIEAVGEAVVAATQTQSIE